MNKKGALELSITAIVVLIIAITVLGFAIYFIRNLFTETTGTIQEQFKQIQERLRQNMETSGESIAFSTGSNIEVKRGKSLLHHIGIKNDLLGPEGTVCYAMNVRCLQAFSNDPDSTMACEGPMGDGTVGGVDTQFTPLDTGSWYSKILTFWDIRNNDFDIEPATLKVPTSVPPDTYLMEVNVFADANSEGCTGGRQFEEPAAMNYRFRIDAT